MASDIVVSQQQLPDGSLPQMMFPDSEFFTRFGRTRKLPTPAEVRSKSKDPAATPHNMIYRDMVVFEELGLLLKFGRYIKIREAQCLWLIKNTLGDSVPTPELHGWSTDENQVFIYMQYIRGQMLGPRPKQEQEKIPGCWELMQPDLKMKVCTQLKAMCLALRRLKQHPSEPFIGKI